MIAQNDKRDLTMMSMMLSSGLGRGEQEKIERLDGPIADAFIRAGLTVRFCHGRAAGERRFLDFRGPTGTVPSVTADQFLAAPDAAAVALVAESARQAN